MDDKKPAEEQAAKGTEPKAEYVAPATTAETVQVDGEARPCQTFTLPMTKSIVTVTEYFSRGEMDDLKKKLSLATIVKDGKFEGFDLAKKVDADALQFQLAVKKVVRVDNSTVSDIEKWRKNLPESDAKYIDDYIDNVVTKKKA